MKKEKPKLKLYKINDEMFGCPLSLWVGDRDLFNTKLQKIDDELAKLPVTGNGKTFAYYEKGYFIIWIGKVETEYEMGVLLHELIHHTFNALEARGVPITHDNDEVFAYYYAYMFKKIMTALRLKI